MVRGAASGARAGLASFRDVVVSRIVGDYAGKAPDVPGGAVSTILAAKDGRWGRQFTGLRAYRERLRVLVTYVKFIAVWVVATSS